MNIEIYTRNSPPCEYCRNAKILLSAIKKVPFTEFVIGKDLSREEFLEKFPDARTLPYVLIDGINVGGYTGLVKYFS